MVSLAPLVATLAVLALPDVPMSIDALPRVSVVVPCFNEAEVLPETHRRLVAACTEACEDAWEIVYVNDGSRDATWSLLCAFSRDDARVVAIDLSRNFGHQRALSAGLAQVRGERILMIDADLQDPPELLTAMMARMDAGADVVYGQRSRRDGESWFKCATAAAFYRLISRLADVDIPVDTGDFRLVSRRVLDALLQLPEQHRFVRGLVAWVGFRQEPLSYARAARFAGTTKYPLGKMVRFAFDAIAAFSIAPLRLSMFFAGLSALIAVGLGGYVLVSWLFFDTVRGWASLLLVVAFFAAVQLFCLGMLGEYIGRIYGEAKRRPLYIVREVVGSRVASGARRSGEPIAN
jgi:polyisoprenyl-phosphate glycosyltransferase